MFEPGNERSPLDGGLLRDVLVSVRFDGTSINTRHVGCARCLPSSGIVQELAELRRLYLYRHRGHPAAVLVHRREQQEHWKAPSWGNCSSGSRSCIHAVRDSSCHNHSYSSIRIGIPLDHCGMPRHGLQGR